MSDLVKQVSGNDASNKYGFKYIFLWCQGNEAKWKLFQIFEKNKNVDDHVGVSIIHMYVFLFI